MRAPWLLAATLLAVTLAGCISEDTPAALTDDGPDTLYVDDRITIENLTDVADQDPTLIEAPRWKLGEWWEITLNDEFVGETHKTYRVVAGGESDDYLVGMPTHDFSNAIMVYHIPGFGQIGRADLSFEIHDCLYEPLKFPLEEGNTWSTQFECRDVEAEVTAVDGLTATVRLIGNADDITLTYDGEQRAITYMRKVGYGSYEVTGHGYDFHETLPDLEGTVTVPHMHDVIFQHGRIGGVAWADPTSPVGLGPYGPTDTVDVDSTYDRVSFAIILGNLAQAVAGVASPVGGYYRETAVAPDGTTFELEMLPTDSSPFSIEAFKHDAPGGEWEFTHIAAGAGIAMAEGIAYHVYDVELPSGRILPSIGEHQHGDEGH